MRAWRAALRIALVNLAANRLRSALTTLGILIGIAAVVVVIALAAGARAQIGGQIESLGSNVLFVFNRPASKGGAKAAPRRGLTSTDAAAIRREAPAVAAVTVFSSVKLQVASELGNATVDVMGVDEHYFAVRSFTVARGRSWTPVEQQSRAKVCLLGPTTVQNLFGASDPIGRHLRLGAHQFQVIGVLGAKGQSPFEDQDDRVILPIESWRARISAVSGDRVGMVMAAARSAEHVPRAEQQITAILRQRHGIRAGEEDDFRVRTQAELRASQEQVLGTLTWLLVSVATIALVVGGIGVMNIMLVSVAERTREIGIRMAIGARRGDVLAQFLFEALLLTLLGGLGGVLLAAVVAYFLGQALGLPLALGLDAILIALGMSTAVGLAFGFLPARRAATLDPIEALRHE